MTAGDLSSLELISLMLMLVLFASVSMYTSMYLMTEHHFNPAAVDTNIHSQQSHKTAIGELLQLTMPKQELAGEKELSLASQTDN